MGYNQNHAGIHTRPYGYKETDNDDSYDRYDTIMSDSQQFNNDVKRKEIFHSINLCNLITIDTEKGQRKVCLCGGKVHYRENMDIKYRRKGETKTVKMTGKRCIECERIFVVYDLLLQALYQNGETSCRQKLL